ncbi:MAG: biotin/lipoyl-binding protein, partial [Candidatus Eisenbacteria bacterium]|nr:biotin/lipoyl-binding protein [Candidatus Eisenbacteria bacterium]
MGAFLALLTTVLALPPIVLISTLASAVLISGCSDSGGAKEPSKRGAGGEAVPVLAATAVTEDFPIRVSAIGKVAPVRSVEVRARVTGELTAVHFAEGQTVRKGDPLFTIDRRPFEAASVSYTHLRA